MHTKHIIVVKANNAELAMSKVDDLLLGCPWLTEDNWHSIVGVVNMNNNQYTFGDTSRDIPKLHSIEGIVEVVKEFANKERYEAVMKTLYDHAKAENWFSVRKLAEELDYQWNVVKYGFDFSVDKITEVAPERFDMFGVTDWTDLRNDDKEDTETFAVVVDFHY